MENQILNKSVLIVDDDLIDRIYLEKYCQKRGLEYKSVKDGDEAIKEIESQKHDYGVIFSDIDMPRKNGIQLVSWIRRYFIRSKSKLLVVAISSNESPNLIHNYSGIGFDHFLSKPADFRVLDSILKIQVNQVSQL